MDENKKYEIAVLADDYYAKRQRSDILAMMNVPQNDPEEARKRFIEYQIALGETEEARRRLATAQNTI